MNTMTLLKSQMNKNIVKHFAWKHIESGIIVQSPILPTKDDLFEYSGFGAVDVDEPLKGYLAVEVKIYRRKWIEI